MPEAASVENLLLRAKRLAALARAKRDNEGEVQAQGQVATALHKLDSLLIEMDSNLKVRRALARAGVPLSPVDDLDKPANALRDQVKNVGRPTAQYLNARSGDVTRLRDSIGSADKQAWRNWAESQIDALGEETLPPFGDHANQARERIQMLRRFAGEIPTRATITSFKVMMDGVRENLVAIDEAVDPEDLKARIAAGGVTLGDLSDEELAELRMDAAIAGRINLSIL
jgi:hypothetical protein